MKYLHPPGSDDDDVWTLRGHCSVCVAPVESLSEPEMSNTTNHRVAMRGTGWKGQQNGALLQIKLLIGFSFINNAQNS